MNPITTLQQTLKDRTYAQLPPELRALVGKTPINLDTIDFASGTKKCTKGVACGGGCIQATKKCRKTMSPIQAGYANAVTGINKKGIESASIDLAQITPPDQAIQDQIDQTEIDDLSELIAATGENLKPVLLERTDDGKYKILAGEKEFLAAQKAAESDSDVTAVKSLIVNSEEQKTALLKQYDHYDKQTPSNTETAPKITSYDDFKPAALDVFDRLNRGYNFKDLVPIYRIRQEFGKRVDRLDFNDWMLKMQEDRILHLHTGGLEATEQQKRDSIDDEYKGLQFFATKERL